MCQTRLYEQLTTNLQDSDIMKLRIFFFLLIYCRIVKCNSEVRLMEMSLMVVVF